MKGPNSNSKALVNPSQDGNKLLQNIIQNQGTTSLLYKGITTMVKRCSFGAL